MTEAPTVAYESRMMIDGKLVDGESGTFTNINPATEEVLGEVADASKADKNRAIDAARRSFDETDGKVSMSLAGYRSPSSSGASNCGPWVTANKGVDEGATMLVGSTEAPKRFDTGFWVDPTLFINVDDKMTIAQEEIFGPVLVVIPYDDEDDAVRIANDSVYGLAGNVMSSSLDRSLAVARRLRAGFIGLNGSAGYGADTPFGGYKESGVGRQNGMVGFGQYTEVKSVAYPAQ